MAAAIYGRRRGTAVSVEEPRVTILSLKNNRVVCSDSGCRQSNALAKEIYATVLTANEFFRSCFNIKGLNRGNPVVVKIDWDEDNAACSCSSIWNGREISCSFQFNNRHLNAETIFHEWGHAVFEHESELGHIGQAGALHESSADCFAMACYEWATGKQPTWEIADRNLAECSPKFHRLRPSERPSSQNDWGYVHANSKIPSHAFFYAVQHTKAKQINVIAQVWFAAMRQSENNETFQSFAARTVIIAELIDSRFAQIIRGSWAHVGIEVL